jgi:hypothetical protein
MTSDEMRERWLANPVDLHYKGQLEEIGVRATDAMEQELIAADRVKVQRPKLSPEEMDYIDSLSGDRTKSDAVYQLQTMNYARLHNFVHWLRDRA